MSHSSDDEDFSDEDKLVDTEKDWSMAQSATRIITTTMHKTVERSFKTDDAWASTICLWQIARSTGWSEHFVMLAIRQFVRVIVAFTFQFAFLWFFQYAMLSMRPYGGQPMLCNMGSGFYDCEKNPSGKNCIGPGGRLYNEGDTFSNFDVWSTRMYVRQALRDIFADNTTFVNEIDQKVIPGEYGLEDMMCRYIVLALLGIQLQDELKEIIDMLVLIHWLPCNDDPWITIDDDVDEDKDDAADEVKFVYGGMTCCWKLYSVLVVAARVFVLVFVGIVGTKYLLDTAGIEDMILNSLALTFILTLDELIQEAWSSGEALTTMEKIEPLKQDRNHPFTRVKDCLHHWLPFPIEMLYTVIFMYIFIQYQFWRYCQESSLGGWASQPRFAVQFNHYSIFPPLAKTTNIAQWCPPPQLIANATCTK